MESTNKGGRPPLPKHIKRVAVPLRLPRWKVDALLAENVEGTITDLIELAATRFYKMKEPKC
jgi:hypothetical protein